MRSKSFIVLIIGMAGCANNGGNETERDSLSKEIRELNAYRVEASLRCSGNSYRSALGTGGSGKLKAEAEISENLLSKGYGTGSLEIGVTLQEKTEFSSLLGNLTADQVERFLGKYQGCMDKEMDAYYKVKGLIYPKEPKTNSIVWNSEIYTSSETKIANQTETSGAWRSYEACVSVPKNSLMIKSSVETKVIHGVAPGTWGTWRKDLKFVDSNAYGPTKVCRGFDHQIHDQDRVLQISVNYKLQKS